MARRKQIAAAATTPNSGPLTAAEVAAWDERLGADTEYVSQWARLVSNYLFGLPAERRVAHLAHALKFYPFVPETPGERFAVERMSEKDWRRHVEFIDKEPNIARAVKTIVESRSSAEEAANMLIAALEPLEADERAVFCGLMIHRRCELNLIGVTIPDKTSTLNSDDIRRIVVSHREAVLPAIVALNHLGCDHTTATDVGQIVLDSLSRVTPEDRPAVLGFLLDMIASTRGSEQSHEGSALRIPPKIAELIRRGNLKFVGIAIGGPMRSGPPEPPTPDKKDLN